MSDTITPPPTATPTVTTTLTFTRSPTVTHSLLPQGRLVWQQIGNLTARNIQSGVVTVLEFVITWDQWMCANFSVQHSVLVEAAASGKNFGIYRRSGFVFTDASLLYCNRTTLRLTPVKDQDYDTYFSEPFTVTFINATLRRWTMPSPRRIPFVIFPVTVPTDVAAAIIAAQLASQSSLVSAGAASSAQGLAIMGAASCARPNMREATKGAQDALSPLPLGKTLLLRFVSNFALVLFFSVLHFPLVVIIREVKRCSWHDARELGQFPSLSFTVVLIVHCGIVYHALRLVRVTDEDDKASRPLGYVGLVYATVMPIATWVWSTRALKTTFVHFTSVRTANANALLRFVVPYGYFAPAQYGGALGDLGEHTKQLMVLPYLEISAFCVIGTIDTYTVPGCIAQYSCLAAVFFVFALIYAVKQPLRSPLLNTLAASMDLLMGSIALCCALSITQRVVGDMLLPKLLLAQNVLGMIVTVVGVALSLTETFVWRPRQRRAMATFTISAHFTSDGDPSVAKDVVQIDEPLLAEGKPPHLHDDAARDVELLALPSSSPREAYEPPPLPLLTSEGAAGGGAPTPLTEAEKPGTAMNKSIDHHDEAEGESTSLFAPPVTGVAEANSMLNDAAAVVTKEADYARSFKPDVPQWLCDRLSMPDPPPPMPPTPPPMPLSAADELLLSMDDPLHRLHPWLEPISAASMAAVTERLRQAEERNRKQSRDTFMVPGRFSLDLWGIEGPDAVAAASAGPASAAHTADLTVAAAHADLQGSLQRRPPVANHNVKNAKSVREILRHFDEAEGGAVPAPHRQSGSAPAMASVEDDWRAKTKAERDRTAPIAALSAAINRNRDVVEILDRTAAEYRALPERSGRVPLEASIDAAVTQYLTHLPAPRTLDEAQSQAFALSQLHECQRRWSREAQARAMVDAAMKPAKRSAAEDGDTL